MVSRANMDDTDLASAMKEFIEHMTVRQAALEEQMKVRQAL